eukprot:9108014-Alexandrium_andersonii.AAC.1
MDVIERTYVVKGTVGEPDDVGEWHVAPIADESALAEPMQDVAEGETVEQACVRQSQAYDNAP